MIGREARLLVEEFERSVLGLDSSPGCGATICITVTFVCPEGMEHHVLSTLYAHE